MTQRNELGKALAKIRIDHDERMSDMAKRLGVSTAYLSAVELGKKKITDALLTNVAREYSLLKSDVDDLSFCALLSLGKLVLTIQTEGFHKKSIIALHELFMMMNSLGETELMAIHQVIDNSEWWNQ